MKHRFQPNSISLYLLCTLYLTLAFSPLVQAATGGVFTRGQSYTLALLGLVTFSLFVYLFVVIFQPERF
jgi:K+-transporting ATPase KdpF subunit